MRFPWLIVSTCALLVVAGAVVLIRPPRLPSGKDPEAVRPVELISFENAPDSRTEGEGMSLRDPVPLYLPTPMNSGHTEALAFDGRGEPVAAFRNYPASLNFSDAGLRVDFPAPVAVPSGVVEAIQVDQGARMFQYVGRRRNELPGVEPRLGYLEVARADDGTTVFAEVLPSVAEAPASDWGPLDMVVAVNTSGLIGTPVVTQSSGSARFDAWLPGYLANSFRIGQRLHPGIYRISLGP